MALYPLWSVATKAAPHKGICLCVIIDIFIDTIIIIMRRLVFFAVAVLSLLPLLCAAADGAGPSGKLPVLYVNTVDPTKTPDNSKDVYVAATAYVDALGLAGYEDMGSKAKPKALQIRGRGNWTFTGFHKKPYRLKFDKKQSPLGLDKSKHFVLLALADDDLGMLTTPVGFELARLLGQPYAPANQPVELVLNGDYRGLYFLTDNIRVAKDRVNIQDQADNVTNPDSVSGGWLVELDNYSTDPHVDVPLGNRTMHVTYHSPEQLSQVQQEYLKGQWTAISQALYKDDTDDTEWEDYVDMESLAQVFLTRELLRGEEGFNGSCYVYKDFGDDKKWRFGPVWDFGSYSGGRKADHYCFQGEFPAYIIDRAWKFRRFKALAKDMWNGFYASQYGQLETFVDSVAGKIKEAIVCDYNRWKDDSDVRSGRMRVTNDETAMAVKFKSWMQEKADWLNKTWNTKDINIYVYVADGKTPYIHIWGSDAETQWPGKAMTETVRAGSLTFYHTTVPSGSSILFHEGGTDLSEARLTQTADINNVTKDTWYYLTQADGDKHNGRYTTYYSGEALVAAGISSPTADTRADSPRYNLSGQRVDGSYRGIVIVGGKKVVIRK